MGHFAGLLGETLKGTDSLPGVLSSGVKEGHQGFVYSLLAGSQPYTGRLWRLVGEAGVWDTLVNRRM